MRDTIMHMGRTKTHILVSRFTGWEQLSLSRIFGWMLFTVGGMGTVVEISTNTQISWFWLVLISAGLYLIIRAMELLDASDTARFLRASVEHAHAKNMHTQHRHTTRLPVQWRHHLQQRMTSEYIIGVIAAIALAAALVSIISIVPAALLVLGFLAAVFLAVFGSLYHKAHYVVGAVLVAVVTLTAGPAWLASIDYGIENYEALYQTITLGALVAAAMGIALVKREIASTNALRLSTILVGFGGVVLLQPISGLFNALLIMIAVMIAAGSLGWLRLGRLSHAKYLWTGGLGLMLAMVFLYLDMPLLIVTAFAVSMGLFALGAMLPSYSTRITALSIFAAAYSGFIVMVLAPVGLYGLEWQLLVSWLGFLFCVASAALAHWYRSIPPVSARDQILQGMILRGLIAATFGMAALLLYAMTVGILPSL
jgi:hypothetical protein